nr:uncharacterized protein LOC119179890 [Rhipicephalus microplus]
MGAERPQQGYMQETSRKERQPVKRCAVPGLSPDKPHAEAKKNRFPSARLRAEKRDAWVAAVRRQNADGSPWAPNKHSRICSAHFITGRPSKFKNHPDFVPSVFTYVRSRGDAAVRRHSRWWKRQKGELDTTATSATPNDTPELQDPPNENLYMDTSAAQDGVLDENSVDLQQLENENPDEGLDATKDDVPDQDSMELQQPENGIKEHIWSDCRCQACASKKIEVLVQEIGNSQKFILQLQKQNAKLEVQLDAAMSRCLTLTTLATPKD